jgi:hypothetical protein
VTGWDGLAYDDFLWMKATADHHIQQQEASRGK